MAPKTRQDARPTALPPRERLLEAAIRLFYEEGIQSVGVDRLIAEAGITKATFYRHFPTKDALVRAYVEDRDQAVRARADALAAQARGPREVLTALVAELGKQACGAGFRGCAFINAAAEYPDAGHPVRQAVAEHRRWFRARLVQLLQDAGHPRAEDAADTLVLLRDGTMTGGYLDDPARAAAALRHAVDAVLAAA
ncbi:MULTISPECIES: helix-turn-helix domain-containing protein [Streptomyces]|uniref:TetR/AcrR family transcriptional regulator n=1 Tax=Streptomyces luteosporeus TaxID=173856 RepID=A0ABP6GJE2_9ACTN